MEENNKTGLHKLNLIDRKTLNITGIVKVNSSNPNNICLKLKESDIIISGANLNITNFNDNCIQIEGNVDSLKYSKQSQAKSSFFKRIFK